MFEVRIRCERKQQPGWCKKGERARSRQEEKKRYVPAPPHHRPQLTTRVWGGFGGSSVCCGPATSDGHHKGLGGGGEGLLDKRLGMVVAHWTAGQWECSEGQTDSPRWKDVSCWVRRYLGAGALNLMEDPT